MNLRDWRKSKGLNLTRGAAYLGLPISTLYDLENVTNGGASMAQIAYIEGATAGKVTVSDMYALWRSACPQKFKDFRDAGRAAAKAYRETPKKAKNR